MKYSPKDIKEKLDLYDFKFKKKFGQNFIVDENIVNNIVKKSGVDNETLVIEIGPGSGSLTRKLSEVANNVICYEVDTSLKNILDEELKQYNNVSIIFKNFLEANVIEDLKKYKYEKLYVVANLPYNITTPIIIKLIEEGIPVDKIVVMVQKEVGDRFKALPGTKDYSSLSVFIKYYFDVKKLIDVSRNVFIPKPNVDSIVVEFIRKEETLYLKDKKLFFKLIRDSFKQKRKTIKNNLKEYNLGIIEAVLKNYSLDLSARAEQISLEIFVDIANNL